MDIQTPAARTTDPRTAHEAGQAVTASGERRRQQQQVATDVWRFPGRTSAELAAVSSLDRWQVARRLPEAETAGQIRRGEARRCGVSRRRALTWWP